MTPSEWYRRLASDPGDWAGEYREFLNNCRARDLKPDQIEIIERKEREAQEPYTLRVERPNRKRACEDMEVYRPSRR